MAFTLSAPSYAGASRQHCHRHRHEHRHTHSHRYLLRMVVSRARNTAQVACLDHRQPSERSRPPPETFFSSYSFSFSYSYRLPLSHPPSLPLRYPHPSITRSSLTPPPLSSYSPSSLPSFPPSFPPFGFGLVRQEKSCVTRRRRVSTRAAVACTRRYAFSSTFVTSPFDPPPPFFYPSPFVSLHPRRVLSLPLRLPRFERQLPLWWSRNFRESFPPSPTYRCRHLLPRGYTPALRFLPGLSYFHLFFFFFFFPISDSPSPLRRFERATPLPLARSSNGENERKRKRGVHERQSERTSKSCVCAR